MRITGNIARRGATLTIHYDLRGRSGGAVAFPAPADRPGPPRPGLWEETCFEFFLAVKDAPQYWEFNLSPAGDWNVYRSAIIGRAWRRSRPLPPCPLTSKAGRDSWRLALEVDGWDRPGGPALEVAIAAVIKLAGGGLTYWALTHPGPRPDFHRRESFLVERKTGPGEVA